MQVSVYRSEFWPTPTPHRAYWERHNCALVYEYDPADDGPEVETIKAIRAMHSPESLTDEQVDEEVAYLLENPWGGTLS